MKGRTILLVEDNPDDVELTLRAFGKNGLRDRVCVAGDGAEAIAYLFDAADGSAPRPLPSVVLLDLQLPKIGGLDVLRRIRANPRTATVPVVILTSSREDTDLLRGYQLGANSYVRKPVDFIEFLEATRQLGLYWLGLNEVPQAVL